MWLRPEQQKVHKMLSEAITMLCRNGLEFSTEFTVEGLLGITLDSKEVFLVNIKERVLSSGSSTSTTTQGYTQKDDEFSKASTEPEIPFPFREYESGSNEGKPPFADSILSGPLTPMMHDFKSPFRRMRGRRKFCNEMRGMRGMRGMRRRFNHPHFRMMHAMMAAEHHPASENPMDLFTKGFGMPPFKRQHMSTEPPDLLAAEKMSKSTQPAAPSGDVPLLAKVKVEPPATGLSGDTEGDLQIDETTSHNYSQENSLTGFNEDSTDSSRWNRQSYDDNGRPSPSRTPSSVGTADNLSETFDDVPEMDPSLITRIKQAIVKEDGCFVTTRMLCRRYSAFFKSHMVVDAMKIITVPTDDPQHIGMFRCLKERSKVFFKCPPNKISPEALQGHNLTLRQYEESYYRMPRPKGMHTPRWDVFVQYVLDSSPYGPMNPTDFTKVMEEKLDPEPGSTMDEFELQHFIVHSEGCFVSSRILCRRLSKQYKVVNVIRAMKAMSRAHMDSNYIGQFVKVSERIKIFFKAPPHLVGVDTYSLYNIRAEQYKQLYYSSPRPWDGSVSNWDSYMENVAARYPFSYKDFPIDSCDISPDIASRIKSIFSGGHSDGGASSYDAGLSSFMDMMDDQGMSDAQTPEDAVERIRNMFGSEVVAGLPPPTSVLDIAPDGEAEEEEEETTSNT